MVILLRKAHCTCRAKAWHDPTAQTPLLTAVRNHGRACWCGSLQNCVAWYQTSISVLVIERKWRIIGYVMYTLFLLEHGSVVCLVNVTVKESLQYMSCDVLCNTFVISYYSWGNFFGFGFNIPFKVLQMSVFLSRTCSSRYIAF